MGTRLAYNLKAFDNKILFNNVFFSIYQIIIPTVTFVPYQPFDHGSFLKVTGDQKKFKILNRGNIKQGHK